jgi:hypothetical protein
MRAAVAAAAAPSICPAQQGTGADDAAGSTVEEGGGGLSRTARAGRRSYERDLKQALQESIAASPKSPSPPQCTESLPVCVPPHQPSHPPHPPAPTPHPPPPSPRPLAPGPWPNSQRALAQVPSEFFRVLVPSPSSFLESVQVATPGQERVSVARHSRHLRASVCQRNMF